MTNKTKLSNQDLSVPHIKSSINSFRDQLDETNKNIRFLTIFITNLLSNKGIVKKLNEYYCSNKVLKREFCYLYLNNIINPLNLIILWKSNNKFYYNLSKKISYMEKKTLNTVNTSNISELLSANYINNSTNFDKILNKEIILDFAYGKLVDNPEDYLIKGKISKFNNPNFFFFLINSFTIEFTNLTPEKKKIIKNFSKQNGFICWESDEKDSYNVLLWNGDNEGVKFHFVDSFSKLGINKDKLTQNSNKNIKPPSLSSSKLLYLEYTLNNILPVSKKIPNKFNYNSSQPIINLLFPDIITLDNAFSYKLSRDTTIFISVSPISKQRFQNSDIGNHNLFYNEKDIGSSLTWFKDQNIDFSLKFDKLLYDQPWTWSLVLQPELIGIIHKKTYYSYDDLVEIFGKNINLFDLSYLTWQLDIIKKKKINNNNSNKYLITLIELLQIGDSQLYTEKLNIKGKKKNQVTSSKFLENWIDLSYCDISRIEYCRIKKKETTLREMLDKSCDKVLFNHLLNLNYLENILKIAEKTENHDLKLILYNKLLDLCHNNLANINKNIKKELETWENIQTLITGQLSMDQYSNNIRKSTFKNKEFDKKYNEIKSILGRL